MIQSKSISRQMFATQANRHLQAVSSNIQIMKSNKGILSILVNLAEFILQSRISPSQTLQLHLSTLKTQLQLLRSQLLPSTEIIHFLVHRHCYNLKNKIGSFLKVSVLQKLVMSITFTIAEKATLLTHIIELWKFSVIQKKEREVSRESRAHELLFLIQRLCDQLSSGELFSELVRNHEASNKYIIDFKIEVKEQNTQITALGDLAKAIFSYASLDNTRQLQIRCYAYPRLNLSCLKVRKSVTDSLSSVKSTLAKNILATTRSDSLELQEFMIVTKIASSPAIFDEYDSELDLTIISSDSDSLSPNQLKNLLVQRKSMEEFELLVEEKDKDQLFVEENISGFNAWQLNLLQAFI